MVQVYNYDIVLNTSLICHACLHTHCEERGGRRGHYLKKLIILHRTAEGMDGRNIHATDPTHAWDVGCVLVVIPLSYSVVVVDASQQLGNRV